MTLLSHTHPPRLPRILHSFRNACVRAGLLNELVGLLATESGGAMHALSALEAIATDDPNTELDNGHALETCKAGAVPPTVRLLASTNEQLQVGAAGLAAVLAENPECQTQLLKAGAVKSLISLGASLSLQTPLPPRRAEPMLARFVWQARTAMTARSCAPWRRSTCSHSIIPQLSRRSRRRAASSC